MEVFGFRRQSADGIVDEDVRACQFCPVQAYDEQSKLFLCDDSTLGFAFECVPLAGGDQHTKERIEVGGRRLSPNHHAVLLFARPTSSLS